MRRLLSSWLAGSALLACTAVQSAETLPPMANLHADAVRARAEGKPLVLLFSLPECKYCEEVRRSYLLPLLRGPASAQPLVRDGEMTGGQQVTGFDGKPTTPRQLAGHYHVRVAPTVVFLDADGRQLAEPLIGGDTSGFYGAYLDNALAESARILHERSAAR